jgi:POLQ-like helicase
MKELNEYLDCFKDELESEENGDNAFINRGPNFELIDGKLNSSIIIDCNMNKFDNTNCSLSKFSTTSLTSNSSDNLPQSSFYMTKPSSCSIQRSIYSTSKIKNNQHSRGIICTSLSDIPSSSITIDSSINSQLPEDEQISEDNSQTKRRRFLATTFNCTFPETEEQNHVESKKNITSKVKNESSKSLNLSFDLNDRENLAETNFFYGLPMKVKDLLKQFRNISCLYEWQHELLTTMIEKFNNANANPHDKNLENLLYLSPTSGGKTLVAEMLILHCLLQRKKDCIFIMPFVSIVQEKVQLMQPFGDSLNFYVEEYAGIKGFIPPLKRRNKNTLYICTIEKAHSLVNSMIEKERFNDELGLVCADELHMIGDGQRGCIYEMILTKVKYCSELYFMKNNKRCFPVQIVATTATLENKTEIAKFLNAFLYERNFRPIELKEYIKLDKQIFEVDKAKLNTVDDCSFVNYVRTLELKDYSAEMRKNDPDGLVALVREVIPNDSCLIFCSSKKNCENVASLLATMLPSEFKAHKRDLKLKLFHEMREENSNNICPILRQSIQLGIAYHHSGLTGEERQLIEQAFKEGVLCVITCTSTLAAGVNLPAKRVIIRSPYVAKDFITLSQYKQMIGRAGRAGLVDTVGESIMLFKSADKKKVYDLISGPMRKCESSFECDNSKALRMLILSLIGLNLTHFGSQILLFLKKTLFYIQKEKLINHFDKEKTGYIGKANYNGNSTVDIVSEEFDYISNAIDYLLRNKLIKLINCAENTQENTLKFNFYAQFEITKLGLATIKGNIDLEYVNQLYEDLNTGLKSIVLSNSLHLLYLCTPYELVNSLKVIDYDLYSRKVAIIINFFY